jgi:hypothetical protein
MCLCCNVSLISYVFAVMCLCYLLKNISSPTLNSINTSEIMMRSTLLPLFFSHTCNLLLSFLALVFGGQKNESNYEVPSGPTRFFYLLLLPHINPMWISMRKRKICFPFTLKLFAKSVRNFHQLSLACRVKILAQKFSICV